MIQPDAETRIRGFLMTLMDRMDASTDDDECTEYTVEEGRGEI